MFSLLILIVGIISCSTNNDDEVDTPSTAVTYNLTLQNNTGSRIFIYLKGSQPEEGFIEKGPMARGEEMVLSGLGVRQTYVVRASFNGEDPEDYFYQQSVFRVSPTDLTLPIEE